MYITQVASSSFCKKARLKNKVKTSQLANYILIVILFLTCKGKRCPFRNLIKTSFNKRIDKQAFKELSGLN